MNGDAEEAGAEGGLVGERFARPLFLTTVLAGSFLLFLMQPMIARMALPRLGGAPAVWNSAMMVYQALLLAGYAYAHLLARCSPRRQAGVHLAGFAVAALWLPIGLTGALLPPEASPALWAPWFLLSSIGPLFFIVSAQAPLMQRWYALETARGDPYPLYAASNLGSFAGLICYPLLVEPLLTLREQSLVWSAGYAVLVLLVAVCALTVPASAVERVPEQAEPAPAPRRILCWVALAAVPSGLMLSTTTHLTTDVVAVPLLWVVPLGLYLLSFVIAFAHGRRAARMFTVIAPLVLLIGGGFAFSDGTNLPFFGATIGLVLLFTIATALHAELFGLRPGPGRLTAFYLAMAVGGVLGGFFCAVVAPGLFDWAYEHPLLLLGAAFLLPQSSFIPWGERVPAWAAWSLVGLAFILSFAAEEQLWGLAGEEWAVLPSICISLVALLFIGRRLLFALCLAALMLSYGGLRKVEESAEGIRTRSYFGVYTVSTRADPPARLLTHGTTLHGVQSLSPGQEREPTSYYARESGIGVALTGADFLFGPNARIGVVGLGTGTLSCYAQPGQSWRFYEIDPAIVRIASDRSRFTFLSGCAPDARVIVGDARISLDRQPPGQLDLLALDAFSSDAVPMHLLTREALGVYARALAPNGILFVHISNRYLDLEPVLAEAARRQGWHAAVYDYVPGRAEKDRNATVSIWVAMTRDPDQLLALKLLSGREAFRWRKPAGRRGFAGWTDDYATIIPLLEDWRSWLPSSMRGGGR